MSYCVSQSFGSSVVGPTAMQRTQASRDDIFRTIIEGTAPLTGDDFFRSLVRNLACALHVRYAFISEFTEVKTRVRTLAFWKDHSFMDNYGYNLAGTPCEKVLRGEICRYAENVQSAFPEDEALVELGAESYLAIPLVDSSGDVLGHLATLDDKPMTGEHRDLSIFKIFAARATAELERKRVESELQTAQAQLVQSEKMAALGQLTAGIVHEINTPIGVIKGNADVLIRSVARLEQILENSETPAEVKNSRDYQECLRILQENSQTSSSASDRIARIAKSLKSFTRLDEGEFQKANIHEGIESTLTLIQNEIKEGISLVKEYGCIPEIHGNHGELNQVFMALLMTAIQAVEWRGSVTIRTFTKEKSVRRKTRGPSTSKILDTGKGMSPEDARTLFDLGFRSQGSRVGANLGLTAARHIVHKHRGQIEVASQVGKGTEFTITLPIEATGVSERQ